MKSKFSALTLLSLALVACESSKDSSDDTAVLPYQNPYYQNALSSMQEANPGSFLLDAPSSYAFNRDGNPGQSTVSYTGQVFRQVLMADLKGFMLSLKEAPYEGSENDLLEALQSYYNYTYDIVPAAKGAINGESYMSVYGMIDGERVSWLQEGSYNSLQNNGKKLSNKIAGNDKLSSFKLRGFDQYGDAGQVVAIMFATLAENAKNPEKKEGEIFLTEKGVHIPAFIEVFLQGAVSYSQAARNYLSSENDGKGLNADNLAAEGSVYTKLEHYWDEGFGYFGAARDYAAYSQEDVLGYNSVDTNQDGLIDLLSEKNFGIAIDAAQVDKLSFGETDFAQKAFEAFIQGRHLIASQPEGYRELVKDLAVIALGNWEKTMAAMVVHKINGVMAMMQQGQDSADQLEKYAENWSQMKAYALSFQFNPKGILNESGFDKLHELFGDGPVFAEEQKASYLEKLREAKNLLLTTYELPKGFGEEL